MGRTFAYCRVGVAEPTLDDQLATMEAANYRIASYRAISESVSGAVPAMERPAFRTLVEHKLEPGDTLVVLALDRLGRDGIDLQRNVARLSEAGVRVVSLDLPVPDLASDEGRLVFRVFEAFADFERQRIAERTREGLARARRRGKALGRPVAVATTEKVQALKADGLSQSAAAARSGLSIATIKRHWNRRTTSES
ncbi:recombinase family protein [Halomonas getboli]|uniref:recombinase family protein n=1 Tax=Halomonas getboli TaxID=2935862 RepID=UPI0020001FA0|nr:recombinase family protein [Halomonas getboli]MCK2183132.1 recombinase family protein [Halomonas getboli]